MNAATDMLESEQFTDYPLVPQEPSQMDVLRAQQLHADVCRAATDYKRQFVALVKALGALKQSGLWKLLRTKERPDGYSGFSEYVTVTLGISAGNAFHLAKIGTLLDGENAIPEVRVAELGYRKSRSLAMLKPEARTPEFIERVGHLTSDGIQHEVRKLIVDNPQLRNQQHAGGPSVERDPSRRLNRYYPNSLYQRFIQLETASGLTGTQFMKVILDRYDSSQEAQ